MGDQDKEVLGESDPYVVMRFIKYILNLHSYPSLQLLQILLDLLAGHNVEFLILSHNGHFNVGAVHLSLKAFLQCHQGSMNGVFNFHVCFVSFLKEYFGILCTLSHGCGFPVVVGT